MMRTIAETYNDKFRWLSINNHPVLILILINLVITIPLAAQLGIWVDEAYTLQTTSKGIGFGLVKAIKFELQAPLYFILLSLWRNINDSIFFSRLFSIICISLSILISYRLSVRYFREINPLYFASIIALNPFAIWTALEIRRYAFVILLSALLFLFFYDAYVDEKENKKAKIYYTITAVVGLYTQYYIGLLLLAHACAILATGNLRRLYLFVLHMLIVGLIFSPMLLVVFDQMSGMPSMRAPTIDLPRIFKVVVAIAENFVIPIKDLPIDRFGRWVLRILAVLSILVAYNRSGHQQIGRFLNPTLRIAIFSVFALLIQLFIILFFVREELLRSRHVSFFLVPAMILVFSVLNFSGNRKFLRSWVFILICLYGIALFQSYRPMAKVGDFKRAASYIMSSEKPGEQILIFPQNASFPFKFHYSGLNIIVPIPAKGGSDSLDKNNWVLNNVLNNESEIVEALSAISKNPAVMWVVRYPVNQYLGVKYNGEIFDQFIEKNYDIKTSKSFFKNTKVMLIEKKQKPPDT